MKPLHIFPLLVCLALSACSNEPTPGMVGEEVLKKLPPGPEITISPKAKNIRAEGPAGGSGGGAGTSTGLAPSK